MKQKIIRILRNFHLLAVTEQVRSLLQFIKSYRKIRNFKKINPNFILPPWGISYDAYAGLNPQDYLNLGIFHAKKITSFIKKYNYQDKLVVCDWGCGPMRVLRHLPDSIGAGHEFIGLDYNRKTIDWAKSSFPDISFKLNNLNPPLPLGDDSVDVIYCISVFTHLSEGVFRAYVDDIYRSLKKGGILIATLHGDRNSINLIKSELDQYNKGQFVVRDKVEEGKRIFASYHPQPFVRDAFSQFSVEEHDDSNDAWNFQQDWWVFKKL
jgi:SAM-dependent methyltransferase